jgi:hypothetical protein
MSYVRLLFESMNLMPKKKVRLWRGIAADLYDEYEPGKIITWWSVSSTTSDEGVARSFMSQLGGVASLIVLDTHSAIDITPLSVYPNEKESLLAPGTRLKVISRKREGNVNELHVEEVDSAVEPRPEPTAEDTAVPDDEWELPEAARREAEQVERVRALMSRLRAYYEHWAARHGDPATQAVCRDKSGDVATLERVARRYINRSEVGALFAALERKYGPELASAQTSTSSSGGGEAAAAGLVAPSQPMQNG